MSMFSIPWIRPVVRWWVANDSTVRQGHVYSNIVASDSIVHYHSYKISGGPKSTKRKRPVGDVGGGPGPINHEVLEKAIAKLADLSTSIGHQRQNDAASKVARRIGIVLEAFKQADDAPGEGHAAEELDKLKYRAILARRVGINTSAQLLNPKTFAKPIEVGRLHDIIEFGNWTITLSTRTVKYRDESGLEYIESLSRLQLCGGHKTQAPASLVTIHLGERTDFHESRFIPPTIMAYRQVSKTSKVFQLIKNDDVDGFRALLSSQRATVRDCDAKNQPLLYLACESASVECCKFLIANGADVDAGSFSVWSPHRYVETPLMALRDRNEHQYRKLEPRAMQCRKMLLEMGADPTISSPAWEHWSPIARAITHLITGSFLESTACIDLILDEGKHFIVWQDLRVGDTSFWLWACREPSPLMLRKLVNAGCDPIETDNHGHNGLFVYFLHVTSYVELWHPQTSLNYEVVKFLLEHGVSHDARDSTGRTITDHLDSEATTIHGSYRQDLWHCVRKRLGFEVDGELPLQSRQWTFQYTPDHYRALLCLESWDQQNFVSQMELLEKRHPLDKEEVLARERWITEFQL